MKIEARPSSRTPQVAGAQMRCALTITNTVVVDIPSVDGPFSGSTTEELTRYIQEIVDNEYDGNLILFADDYNLIHTGECSVDVEYVPNERDSKG